MHRLIKFCAATALLLGAAMPAAAEFDSDSPTVFITGSNRGIGLAFARHYAAQGWNVIATARSPERADDLQLLQKKHPQVAIERLDVTSLEQIEALA